MWRSEACEAMRRIKPTGPSHSTRLVLHHAGRWAKAFRVNFGSSWGQDALSLMLYLQFAADLKQHRRCSGHVRFFTASCGGAVCWRPSHRGAGSELATGLTDVRCRWPSANLERFMTSGAAANESSACEVDETVWDCIGHAVFGQDC